MFGSNLKNRITSNRSWNKFWWVVQKSREKLLWCISALKHQLKERATSHFEPKFFMSAFVYVITHLLPPVILFSFLSHSFILETLSVPYDSLVLIIWFVFWTSMIKHLIEPSNLEFLLRQMPFYQGSNILVNLRRMLMQHC